MKLDLTFGSALCYTPTFEINGVGAASEDFGEQYDRSPETAEDYGCGGMRFTRIPPTPEVLTKYGINLAEYSLVAGQLEVGLSFGSCSWCS